MHCQNCKKEKLTKDNDYEVRSGAFRRFCRCDLKCGDLGHICPLCGFMLFKHYKDKHVLNTLLLTHDECDFYIKCKPHYYDMDTVKDFVEFYKNK